MILHTINHCDETGKETIAITRPYEECQQELAEVHASYLNQYRDSIGHYFVQTYKGGL